MASVHNSPFAGSWYPGQPAELSRLIDEVFERSAERTGAEVLPGAVALLVPHAGLRYSGTVAAASYRAIAQARPERIILLGFSHRGGPAGVAIPDVDSIATPCGSISVDRQTASALAGKAPFAMVRERQVCDHSVEIQLPLLLRAAPGVPVLPLYAGPMDEPARDAAAHELAALAGPGTVFLASSDLTHYGPSFHYVPFPPDRHVHECLRDLDFSVLDAIGSLDAQLFLEHLAETGSTVCGYMPLALLLKTVSLVGEDIYQQVLDYDTSGEMTGDAHHSVSYAAAGFYHAASFALGPEDQQLLLASAQATLKRLLETGRREPVPPTGMTPAVSRRAGVFVSLHEGSDLRGCVGNRIAAERLSEAVPQLTLSAALDDPRFRPLRSPSRPVSIEISVLTPMKRVRDASGFRLGHHGVYLASGRHRALLLPQVARDREWTPESFLDALAHKAGLVHDAWRKPEARLFVFEAQTFSATV